MKGLIGFSRRVLVVYGVPVAGIFILTRFDMDEDLRMEMDADLRMEDLRWMRI